MLTFKTKLYIGFALVFILTAISGTISYLSFQKQAELSEQVKRTYRIINISTDIQNLVVDMETGRRGFRVTNDERFLEPYKAGSQKINTVVASLKDMISNDPEQKNRVTELEGYINNLILFWKNNGTKVGGYAKEAQVDITSSEKAQMDKIRSILNEILGVENGILVNSEKENKASINNASLASFIDTIIVQIIILILIFFIIRELTWHRRAKEQLRQSNITLSRQADSLKTSGEELKNALDRVEIINKQLEKFVYIVAHDIKSPLSGISGALSIIGKDEAVAVNSKLAKFVNLSNDSVLQLSDMVNSILEYSRTSFDQQSVELISIKEVIEHVAHMLVLPENVLIQVADDMPVFKTKGLKLQQVFQNLVSNAIKYNDKALGFIEIGYEDRNDYYEFSVKDNGRGISKDDSDKVFTLFKPVHTQMSSDTSTGFGLSIVKFMIEEQGGRIWFDSVPGVGSTFYFLWRK